MEKTWTPADLLQMSGGYWSACALHAGVKLDMFTPLAKASLTTADLAEMLGVDARALGMLLNAFVALNLLEKKGATYAGTPFAAEYLSRSSEKYLGHIILHHHHLMDNWSRLDEGVKKGGPVAGRVSHDADETFRESFLMGMFNLAMQLAPRIVPAIDLGERKRLLDLGGGPGTYAIQFCKFNNNLDAVIYDLPTTRRFAEATIGRFGLSQRISFVAGDFIVDEIPGGFDVAWLSHVLHSEGPEGCATLIAKTANALEPGGILLIQEFILDDSLAGPVFPALFSLNMLLGTPSGQAYSESQITGLLSGAGMTNVRRLDIDLPNGAGIIVAIKPA